MREFMFVIYWEPGTVQEQALGLMSASFCHEGPRFDRKLTDARIFCALDDFKDDMPVASHVEIWVCDASERTLTWIDSIVQSRSRHDYLLSRGLKTDHVDRMCKPTREYEPTTGFANATPAPEASVEAGVAAR